MDIKLFGHYDSGHAYKVALALRLANIPFEYERVDIWAPRETRPKAFLDASRFREVPCLIVDGKAKTQSGAILSWIAREFDVLGGRARHDEALEWVIWEANRIGMCIPQLIQGLKTPEAFSEGAIGFLKARFEIDISRFEKAISGKKFILGDDVTIADIAIFGYLGWHENAQLDIPKDVQNWIGRIRALPHFVESEAIL